MILRGRAVYGIRSEMLCIENFDELILCHGGCYMCITVIDQYDVACLG